MYAAVGLIVLVGAWFIGFQPLSPDPVSGPRPGGSAPAASAASSAPTSSSSRGCRPGTPERLVIPALGVDAGFQRIGVDRTAAPDASGKYPLGVPTDRTKAGWYAEGPEPGAGVGTVLMNGHTYRDGSAIFQADFANAIQKGQRIDVVVDNGTRCSYEISRVWRDVNSQRDYPRIVQGQHLYNFSGPERLFLATCGGNWNALSRSYDDISIVLAVPVSGA